MVKYSGDTLTLVFTALAHPIRRGIIERSLHGKANLSSLAKVFEVSLPAINKHIKVLQKAELIFLSKEGREKDVQVNVERLEEATLWIAEQRKFWEASLTRLEQYLEQEDDS